MFCRMTCCPKQDRSHSPDPDNTQGNLCMSQSASSSPPPVEAAVSPRLSIITVCKNAESVIGSTITSVMEQSSSSIQFLILDGASTDETGSVIRQLGKDSIELISEPDNGIYHAMNKGIRHASGEFLLFLNAGDTLLHTQTVESLLCAIDRAPYADVYHAAVVWFDPRTGRSRYKPALRDSNTNLFRGSLNHQAMFIRRELFERFGAYDESFRLAGDYEWVLRAKRKHHCRFERLNACSSVFLLGGQSTSGEHDELIRSECKRSRDMYYGSWDKIKYRILIRVRKILGI